MLEVLKKCCETKKPVSLYVDPDRPTAFRYGEVLAVNGEELLTLMVSPEGNYDGLLLLSTPDIYRIEVDTQYNKRMEILTKPFEKPALQVSETNIKQDLLGYLAAEGRIASFSIGNGETVYGTVTERSDGYCTIRQVDYYGKADGISYLDTSEISTIEFDPDEMQELNTLRNHQNGQTNA